MPRTPTAAFDLIPVQVALQLSLTALAQRIRCIALLATDALALRTSQPVPFAVDQGLPGADPATGTGGGMGGTPGNFSRSFFPGDRALFGVGFQKSYCPRFSESQKK